jgi:hypothetical protein
MLSPPSLFLSSSFSPSSFSSFLHQIVSPSLLCDDHDPNLTHCLKKSKKMLHNAPHKKSLQKSVPHRKSQLTEFS